MIQHIVVAQAIFTNISPHISKHTKTLQTRHFAFENIHKGVWVIQYGVRIPGTMMI